MTDSQIAALDFNASVTSRELSSAFVPVLDLNNATDFDFDSLAGFVYWIEYDSIRNTVHAHTCTTYTCTRDVSMYSRINV